MQTFTPSPQLQALLAQMSRDMAVPVEGLVNQAIFNWAKLLGYLEPAGATARPVPAPKAAQASEAQGEDDVEWKLASDGSFNSPSVSDTTSPSLRRQRQIVLVLGDREVIVVGDRCLVGRDVICHLAIDSPRISRQHAVIHVSHDQVSLEDLGSSNGTWFQGERIQRRVLADGDEVRFGDTPVRVEFR